MDDASAAHDSPAETLRKTAAHAGRLERQLQRLRDDLAARADASPDYAEGVARLDVAIAAARDVAGRAAAAGEHV